MYDNLKEGLGKIIGGTVESAFELRNGRGIFVTIRTNDKPMALVVEENANGTGEYGETHSKPEIYVIESMV